MGPSSARGGPNATTERLPLIDNDGKTALAGDSETTPLLSNHDDGHDAENDAAAESTKKPFPKAQLLLLCYARVTEPIAFFCIFPFIAAMVQRNGHLPASDVGLYSGLIESLFSATQMLVLIFWGRLADKIGRKPVLIGALIGTAIGPAIFGLATSLPQMILFRCLAGVFSGSSLVIRTMIAEVCGNDATQQAVGFGWFAVAGNVGIFLGPLIGGALADPAAQYPRSVFASGEFWEKYPYALPGFVTGAISLTSAITCAILLKETLVDGQAKKNSNIGNNAHTTNGNGPSTEAESTKPHSTWSLLRAPGVLFVLYIYSHAMFLAFAFTAMLPVVLFTPVALGGLGFDSFKISIYMAIQGFSQAFWLLLLFPSLHRRLKTKGVMVLCGAAYPFFFLFYIVVNILLRIDGYDGKGHGDNGPAMVFAWITGLLVAVVGPGVSMCFTGVQLALNDVSPDPHVLGTLNALALTFSSAIRAIVPGAATAIYAIGVRGHILGGHLAWVMMIVFAIAFSVTVRKLPSNKMAEQEEE